MKIDIRRISGTTSSKLGYEAEVLVANSPVGQIKSVSDDDGQLAYMIKKIGKPNWVGPLYSFFAAERELLYPTKNSGGSI